MTTTSAKAAPEASSSSPTVSIEGAEAKKEETKTGPPEVVTSLAKAKTEKPGPKINVEYAESA